MRSHFASGILILAFIVPAFHSHRAVGQLPPAGFSQFKAWTGVGVYRNSTDTHYVTIVNLTSGRMVNLTGSSRLATVNGKPNVRLFTKQSIPKFWQDASVIAGNSRAARVVINGAFFTDVSLNPETTLSHGGKAFGRVLTKGEDLANLNSILNIKYNPFRSQLQISPYSDGDFSNAECPDLLGGFSNSVDKDRTALRQRTFVGINGQTLVLLSSKAASQAIAEQILRAFGATSVVMLDGGGSTGLIIDGTPVIRTDRKIPNAIGILGPR